MEEARGAADATADVVEKKEVVTGQDAVEEVAAGHGDAVDAAAAVGGTVAPAPDLVDKKDLEAADVEENPVAAVDRGKKPCGEVPGASGVKPPPSVVDLADSDEVRASSFLFLWSATKGSYQSG